MYTKLDVRDLKNLRGIPTGVEKLDKWVNLRIGEWADALISG